MGKIGAGVAEIMLVYISEVLFCERSSSFKVSIRFGLVLKAYSSNLSKIGPMVAEIFLVLTFEVFFHTVSYTHLTLPTKRIV